MDDVYPYEKDPHRHPWTWAFFNVPGAPRNDLDTAETYAKHCEAMGMGAPESARPSTVIYDALGSSGGPWEPGTWRKRDEGRMQVVATAPDKDITAMTDEERAELRAALDAADDAHRAGSAGSGNSDEMGEG